MQMFSATNSAYYRADTWTPIGVKKEDELSEL